MKRLLIDVGNTRIKGCIANESRLGKIVSKYYSKIDISRDFNNFLTQFKPKTELSKYITTFDTIDISLADRSLYSKVLYVCRDFKTNIININTPLPIRIDYADTLGSDRICSAVGAYKKFTDRKNLLVIDFGTATTFNVISKGVFRGGMISTGIRTSADALMTKTTLPKVFLNAQAKLINNETKGAIISGIVFQQVLFVQKAIEGYRKLFKDIYVIATGGGSEIIKQYKTGIDKYEANLVIEGLNHISIYNEDIRKK